MKAFTKSKSTTGRSATACGYCRQTGHSIRECPHVEYDYLEWQAFRVPHQSATLQHNRWLANDYSYWVKQVNKYYPKWEKAQQQTSPSGTRVATTRKCGFCRGEGHTRRDCPEMATMYADLLQANRNYRQAIYDRIVTQLGIGVGAVLKVQTQRGYYSNREIVEHIATVTALDIDTANVFQTVDSWALDRDFRGDANIEVMIGNDTRLISLDEILVTRPDGQSEKGFYRGGRYNTAEYVETIAPSKQPLEADWVDRDADAFEWLLKKKTKEWLLERSCISSINRWK